MKFNTAVAALALTVATGLPCIAGQASAPLPWVTAYYPTWEQNGGMTPDQIDFSAITHLVHFAVVPSGDGTLTGITPEQSQAVISRAHRGGAKVLLCLGGEGSGTAISLAIAAPRRVALIQNLVNFVSTRGYDGVDIDMEPINPADEDNFVQFIQELRARMKSVNPRWLLTFPASGEPGDQPKLCALLQNDFDQINIQTYDLSGKWPGFKTWYNGSLYGDGQTLMTDTRAYPSADEKVRRYVEAGVPKAKLGIGLAFYGYVWSGADGPAQSTQGVSLETLGYNQIMDQYFRPNVYRWDANAHAPYLSIDGPQAGAKKFISYDDARLAREKVLYARTHGLGGVIIWQLGGGYRASQPPGRRDVLLKVVKEAAQGYLGAGSAGAAQ